jgi:hypothetical protein
MDSKHLRKIGITFAGLLVLTASGLAQTTAQSASQRVGASDFYDVARENVVQGTVVAYTTSSASPPLGAHVRVQTSSGFVDVHIGNGKLLDANHLVLQPGDAVRITGENVAFADSTIFAARLIQKGTQTVAVRSIHGSPLVSLSRNAAQQGGVR